MGTLPTRASDAGPESKEADYDWDDYRSFAVDCLIYAGRAQKIEGGTPREVNAERLHQLDNAIKNIVLAKEMLCQ